MNGNNAADAAVDAIIRELDEDFEDVEDDD